MPTLPDIKSKVTLNTDSLTQASKTSAVAHAQMQDHVKASTTHTLRFDQSLTTLLDHFGGMPPIVNEAGRSLESMASQGVGGMQLIGGAAAAGFGLVVAAIGESIKSYTDLGDKVENYARATGGSAEESSRMVEMFQQLGVSADVATSNMERFAKNIEAHTKKLEADGLQVATNSVGNVDMANTLYNLADAYTATADPAKRAQLLADSFGKSGKDMIPVLEVGSAHLKAYAESAGMVFTQGDLDRLKQYNRDQAELSQNLQEFEAQIGGQVIPVLGDMFRSMNQVSEASHLMTDSVSQSNIETAMASRGGGRMISIYEDQAAANYANKQAMDLATQTIQQQANAQAILEADTKAATDAIHAQANDEFALADAQMKAKESADAITAAQVRAQQAAQQVTADQTAYNDAVRGFGANSQQAVDAQEKLTLDQIAARNAADAVNTSIEQQEKDYLAVAEATVTKAQADAKAAGDTLNNEDSQKLLIKTLQDETHTLDPASPLYQYLAGYINKLIETPSNVYTTFHQRTVDDSGSTKTAGGTKSFASGGRPPVGPVFMVGEQGPELMRLDQPATVYPHGQDAGGGGADMSRVEQLLQESNSMTRQMLEHLANPPQYEEQTGDMVGLANLVALAMHNRHNRGMRGA